jgi:hypothetical protein
MPSNKRPSFLSGRTGRLLRIASIKTITQIRATQLPHIFILHLALHAGAVTATYQRLYEVVERDRRADKGLALGRTTNAESTS